MAAFSIYIFHLKHGTDVCVRCGHEKFVHCIINSFLSFMSYGRLKVLYLVLNDEQRVILT